MAQFDVEYDVVCIGGGASGKSAAYTIAKESDLSVVVLEKKEETGGSSIYAEGTCASESVEQQSRPHPDYPGELPEGAHFPTHEEHVQRYIDYSHHRANLDVAKAFVYNSGETISMYKDLGIEYTDVTIYAFDQPLELYTFHRPEGLGQHCQDVLLRACENEGIDIFTSTPAKELIFEDGKIVGVLAPDADGNDMRIGCKYVVLSTGGFGNNPEMIEKEFGLHIGKDYFPFRIPGITGDGLKMMWEVGAEKFGQNIEAIYQLPDNLNWFLLDAVLRQPNLMINRLGDRFMNEGDLGNTTYAGNAIALQPGNYGYCIMDEGILKQYKKNGPDIVDIVHPAEAFLNFEGQAKLAVEQGYEAYFEAETIPELAEKLGIDADKLQQTIDDYNAMCRCGVDSQFHKPQKYLHPITGKGKYLVGKYYLGAYGTVGGVRVNKYCEVLNKDHLPIEGLYSAGSDANTLYGDSYNFTLPGNSMGFAVNSGRMAGEAIAQYIADCQ